MLKRQQLTSGSLGSVGYAPDGGVLEVEFTNGLIQRYLRVPRRLYLGLINASSPDAFFNEKIRHDFTYYEVREHAFAV